MRKVPFCGKLLILLEEGTKLGSIVHVGYENVPDAIFYDPRGQNDVLFPAADIPSPSPFEYLKISRNGVGISSYQHMGVNLRQYIVLPMLESQHSQQVVPITF